MLTLPRRCCAKPEFLVKAGSGSKKVKEGAEVGGGIWRASLATSMYDVKRKSHRFFYTEAIAGCSPIVSKYVQKDVVLSQKRVSCLGRFFCFLGFIPVNLTCLGTKDRLHQIGLWTQRAFSQLLTDAEGPSPPNPKQGSLGCVRKVTDCEPGSKPVRCIAPWLLLQAPPWVSAQFSCDYELWRRHVS